MNKQESRENHPVKLKQTKPDCTEKCPECQGKVCDHSGDEAKLHLNTIIRKIREGKIVT